MPDKHRINVNVSENLYNRWIEVVPNGMKGHLLEALIESTVRLLEKKGIDVIGVILAGRVLPGINDDVA